MTNKMFRKMIEKDLDKILNVLGNSILEINNLNYGPKEIKGIVCKDIKDLIPYLEAKYKGTDKDTCPRLINALCSDLSPKVYIIEDKYISYNFNIYIKDEVKGTQVIHV